MGKRGPTKTPTALLEKRGNPHLKERRENEPRYTPCQCPCPVGIKGLSEQAWNYYAPLLASAGVTTEADWTALEALCRCYGEWREAIEKLETKGSVTCDDRGNEKVSPWFKIRSDSEKRLMQWLARFGLTPANRPDIQTLKPKTKQIMAIT